MFLFSLCDFRLRLRLGSFFSTLVMSQSNVQNWFLKTSLIDHCYWVFVLVCRRWVLSQFCAVLGMIGVGKFCKGSRASRRWVYCAESQNRLQCCHNLGKISSSSISNFATNSNDGWIFSAGPEWILKCTNITS
jgi:hypothetical protein